MCSMQHGQKTHVGLSRVGGPPPPPPPSARSSLPQSLWLLGCLTHRLCSLAVSVISVSLRPHGLSLSVPVSLTVLFPLILCLCPSFTVSLSLVVSLNSLACYHLTFHLCLSVCLPSLSLPPSLQRPLTLPVCLSASLPAFLTWFPHSGKRSGRCWGRRS